MVSRPEGPSVEPRGVLTGVSGRYFIALVSESTTAPTSASLRRCAAQAAHHEGYLFADDWIAAVIAKPSW